MSYRCKYLSKPFPDHPDPLTVSTDDDNAHQELKDDLQNLDTLTRKRKGGKFKVRQSEETKMLYILTRLPHSQMSDNILNGRHISQILDFIPGSQNQKVIQRIVDKLEQTRNIEKKEASKSDRVKYYYFKTDKGDTLLKKIIEKRGLLQ